MKPASPIHLLERDYFLALDKTGNVWPPSEVDHLINSAKPRWSPSREEKIRIWLADNWHRQGLKGRRAYLYRDLTRKPGQYEQPTRGATTLREVILRFPSAPLFGLQSKTGFQVQMDPIHQHTLRLLTSSNAGEKQKPRAKKLFLMFNGLNELDSFDFYYDLSALLIEQGRRDDIACLICPFPAHLTRYPLFGKYAEKPLQRFITDPSDLFRQYLRFMVEMHWLISTLVPVSDYPVASGIPLLEKDTNPTAGRCDSETLSKAIFQAWEALFQVGEPRGPRIVQDDVRQSITVIRELIGWSCSTTKLVDREPQDSVDLDPPQIHVIGYSLGGYLAQCVFFTWPYAIGSCTTLCSGGALGNLRPERIVHEEEWRAITHGLQYEIESGILEGRIAADNCSNPESVCGIPVSYFTSHFQTFNDIFLQDPQGSYRHRVSEFAPRLFFVVGGNDPIVPTRSVLETSPPEGINMIEIANLSHFIAKESGEWPNFWLPTIAGIISSLSEHSERLLRKAILENLWNEDSTDGAKDTWLLSQKEIVEQLKTGDLPPRKRSERRDAEPLDSEQIQAAILQFVGLLHKKGILIILRNQIPVTLMGPAVLHRRGVVPHYADHKIRRFWERLQEQRLLMLHSAPQVTIVVPARLIQWFSQRPSTLSPKHLPVNREFPDRNMQQQIWNDFLNDWEDKGGALYRFNPEHPKDLSANHGTLFDLERMIREDTATPIDRWVLNCLPDTWISLSQEAVKDLAGGGLARAKREDVREKLIESMCDIYAGGRRNLQVGDPQRAAATRAKEKLEEWLDHKALQVIRISAAQSSPRFLGERISRPDMVIDVLTHSALALARSQPCYGRGEFERGWNIEDRST